MKKALLIGNQNVSEKMIHILTQFLGYCSTDICVFQEERITHGLLIHQLNTLADASAELEEIWIYMASSKANLDNSGSALHHNTSYVITDSEMFRFFQRISCRTIVLFDHLAKHPFCELEWMFEYRSPNHCLRTQNSEKSLENKEIVVYNSKGTQFLSTFLKCLEIKDFTYSTLFLYGDISTSLKAEGGTPISFSTSSLCSVDFQKMPSPIIAPTVYVLPTTMPNPIVKPKIYRPTMGGLMGSSGNKPIVKIPSIDMLGNIQRK
jgi:hypothetical protein